MTLLTEFLESSYKGYTGSRGFTGSRGDTGFIGSRGFGLFWTRVTSNTTAVSLNAYLADTTSGSFSITLPASPVLNDVVVISDGGDWGTNNLTVLRNGSTIEGLTQDLILNIGQTRVEFIYDGSTWQVASSAGQQGPIGFTGSRGSGLSWTLVTEDIVAVNLNAYIADTSGGSFTITLPASPSANDIVVVTDGADWSINNLIILRNGSTIEGIADDLTVNVPNLRIEFVYNGSTWIVIASVAEIGYTGSIGFTGSQGPNNLPINSQDSNYTLEIEDVGKAVVQTSGDITVPSSVFSAGDLITIYNNSTSSITVEQGSGVTLRLAGTSTTGSRTLAQRGLVSLFCVSSTEFVASGAGLT